jgi:hypothetical protein
VRLCLCCGGAFPRLRLHRLGAPFRLRYLGLGRLRRGSQLVPHRLDLRARRLGRLLDLLAHFGDLGPQDLVGRLRVGDRPRLQLGDSPDTLLEP